MGSRGFKKHPWRSVCIGSMILLGITSASSQESVRKDEDLERLQRIQLRHETEIMAIPGVLGIGIGSDAHKYVFQIMVDKTARKKPKLPAQIEGVPVKVVLTGPIVAQSTTKKVGKPRNHRRPRAY